MSGPDANQTEPTPLDYAQRTRLTWIARHRRPLIFLALIIAIAGPLWWYWPSLKRRVLWLYWFHQAAAHVMPGPIPLRASEAQAKALATTNPDYLLLPPVGAPQLRGYPAEASEVFQRGARAATQPSAIYSPVAFRELLKVDGRLQLTGRADGPITFLGTLRRPDGTPRLVIVTNEDGMMMTDDDLLRTMGVIVLPQPGWFDPLPPMSVTPLVRGAWFANIGPIPPRLDVFGAVADKDDPSHIVIRYTIAPMFYPDRITGQGEIDAYLQNDDSLRVALRGPGKLLTTALAGDPKSLDTQAAAQSWVLHPPPPPAPASIVGGRATH